MPCYIWWWKRIEIKIPACQSIRLQQYPVDKIGIIQMCRTIQRNKKMGAAYRN